MIPDVSDALIGWTIPVLIKTVTETTIDFQPTVNVTGETYHAMVQPTEKTTLNAESLDWSQKHYSLFGPHPLQKGQLFEYKGADYKIVETEDWEDFGYFESIGEATNRPVIEVTQDEP